MPRILLKVKQDVLSGVMMKSSFKQQHGLTLITIVFILAIFSFFLLLGFKIGPIYLNHSKVVNALMAVKETDGIERMSKQQIRIALSKRFNMNYVEKVDLDDVKITKHGNYVKVEIAYERVEKILGNLSVLVDFYDHFEAGEDT